MSKKPIPTRPIRESENLLREKFYESIAAQSDLMDKLSGQLLTLELAIPGIYATALKLVAGDDATLTINLAFYITVACWLMALGFTLLALTPRNWTVDPDILEQDPKKTDEALGIEDYFNKSARYKRRLVILSSVLFFSGTISAIFTIG
jgi:hypothetical protein